MDHLMLKAATTATEQGTFEAVISTDGVDREKDIVSPAGMVRALQKWTPTGKKIPLAWNHSGDPDLQIGFIDPHSAKQVGGEVQVTGWIDRTIDAGAHAWRLVKAGTLGFSFGYLILQGTKRRGGGRNIDELDVFEATATPTPMNNDTRILSYKAMTTGDLATINDPAEILSLMTTMARAYINNAADDDDAGDMNDILQALQDCADGMDDDASGKALLRAFVKAVWSTAYVNNLPDSAFLYIAPGGDKDSDGKTTPRSDRYFPVRDANGDVDLPHLRNALGRIPQSDLPQAVKDSATAKAQRMLDSTKSVDEATKETKSRVADPLRARADAVALEFVSDGESLKKPPARKDAPKPIPLLSLEELKRRTRDETLIALSGVDDI